MGKILVRSVLARAAASAVVCAAVGCSSAPSPRASAVRPAPAVVAATSSGAVQDFLRAAQVGDPRTMGALFGTREGSVTTRDPAADVEKRMIALACYLTHDSAQVLGDVPGVAAPGERIVTVELRSRDLVRQTRFTTVPGPGGRWFVQSFDIDAVSDLCRPR